jgi:hypothetical protein
VAGGHWMDIPGAGGGSDRGRGWFG